jgi:hypothetical protein
MDSLYFDISADMVKDMKFLKHGDNFRFYVHTHHNDEDWIILYKLEGSKITVITTNKLYDVIQDRLYSHEKTNGDILFSGDISEVNGNDYTDVLISLFENNNLSWSHRYGRTNVSEKSAGIMYKNESIYLVNNVMADKQTPESIVLKQFDADGYPQKQYSTHLDGENYVCDFVESADNEFLFTGFKRIDNKNSRAFMARDSIKGGFVLEKTYGDKGFSKGKFIRNLPDGNGYIIAGNISTSGLNSKAKDVVVIKMNENCNWIEE